jgi:hypothetical protein
MTEIPSRTQIVEMAARCLPGRQLPENIRIFTDTTDFFKIEYDDVVVLDGNPYLIRHNAKEQRFGLDDETKYWVKYALDLRDGSRKIIKLVFYERFTAMIGDIRFERFRSPKKEARILDLVRGHPNFMQGFSVHDEKGNVIRVLDLIKGPTLTDLVHDIQADHKSYFYDHFPSVLLRFMPCIEGIGFLHERKEKHGDIRRDHVLADEETGDLRWIDFDYNYRHRENIYGFDLFGLGNILVFLAGKGDVIAKELRDTEHPALASITEDDLNIVFNNRIVNLRKVYPYIPETFNNILMHFSKGSKWFYENTGQLIEDLREYLNTVKAV